MTRLVPPALLLLTLAAACGGPQYVARREMPARGPSDAAQQPTIERYDGYTSPEDSTAPDDASTAPITTFCNEIATTVEGRKSLGCFPLVLTDPRRAEPWVPEYGVDVADQVAGWMRTRGFATTVLTTTEMGARLDEALGVMGSLSTLAAMRRHADALDVELAVFGTLRRNNNVGREGRDVLTVDLQCYDFVTQKLVTRTRFEVPSDDAANARIWSLAQRESSWLPDPH